VGSKSDKIAEKREEIAEEKSSVGAPLAQSRTPHARSPAHLRAVTCPRATKCWLTRSPPLARPVMRVAACSWSALNPSGEQRTGNRGPVCLGEAKARREGVVGLAVVQGGRAWGGAMPRDGERRVRRTGERSGARGRWRRFDWREKFRDRVGIRGSFSSKEWDWRDIHGHGEAALHWMCVG
jgi:hypothetical protein